MCKTENRFVIGMEHMLLAGVCVQFGNFTDWGIERVRPARGLVPAIPSGYPRPHLQPDFSNTSIAQNDPKNNTQPSDEEMTHPVKHTACAP